MSTKTPLIVRLLLCLWLVGGASSYSWAGFVFANPATITIPRVGQASPYPSSIAVSGITQQVSNISVSLFGVSHTYPNDLAAVVVAPTGKSVILFSGPGRNVRAVNLDWVFEDKAAGKLPDIGALSSGVFRPGQEEYDDFFPGPGPGGKRQDSDPAPWAFEFRSLLADSPNGDWNLFILDAQNGDNGMVARGWQIEFELFAVPEANVLGLAYLLIIPVFSRTSRRKSSRHSPCAVGRADCRIMKFVVTIGYGTRVITANSCRTAPPVRTLISDRRSGRATMDQTQREESTVREGQGRTAQM